MHLYSFLIRLVDDDAKRKIQSVIDHFSILLQQRTDFSARQNFYQTYMTVNHTLNTHDHIVVFVREEKYLLNFS
jgi:hypothetical protein